MKMNILWDGPNPAPTCVTQDVETRPVDPRDLKLWQGQQRINMLELENQALRNIVYRDKQGEVCENCAYYTPDDDDVNEHHCTRCLCALSVNIELGVAEPWHTSYCSGFKVRA
jgi:uncharacterized paraquat-inducible protein A